MLEPPVSKAQLLILGGGHIALPVAGMAKIFGFEVSVVDDRQPSPSESAVAELQGEGISEERL